MEVQERDWEEWFPRWKWKQGEHVTLVGPTGGGKTTLAQLLLPRREYVVVFATKRKDSTLERLRKSEDYRITSHFEGVGPGIHKWILNPGHKGSARETHARQAVEFRHALDIAYHQGGWCVYVDEGKRICDTLKLATECETLWQEGRSLGASLVMSVQRPVKIPLAAYDQPTHLFFWRDMDDANLKRIGGIGGMSNRTIREVVSTLDWDNHEVLYLNTRSGEMVRTKVKV